VGQRSSKILSNGYKDGNDISVYQGVRFMPFPLLVPIVLGGFSLLAAAAGIGASIEAKENFDKASKIGDSSEKKHKKSVDSLEFKKNEVKDSADELGNLKNEIYQKIIKDRFVSIYNRFKSVKIKELKSNKNDFSMVLTENEFKEFKAQAISFTEAAGGILSAAGTGAGVSLGTYALVGYIGTAGTGAAITGLSGIAAKNATLAWLGGGTLKAGGLGMAGGSAVLGGLILGPAIFIGGFVYNKNSEKALTKAIEYEAEVNKACEKIDAAIVILESINKRIIEFYSIINKLKDRFVKAIKELEDINLKLGNKEQYQASDLEDKNIMVLFKVLTMAKCMKILLETPIIDNNGDLNEKSAAVLQEVENVKIN
jgi:hypothetical protein